MKVLITGARGFVGPYVARAVVDIVGPNTEVIRSSISRESRAPSDEMHELDVTDFQSVLRQLERIRPTHIVHLAGLAAVPAATANSALAWRVHLHGTLNIAQAVLQTVPECVLLYVGSGQVYGSTAKMTPVLTESSLLAPTNPYEASKASADLAIGAMALAGLRAIRLRPFNHTGPGQSEQFVVPALAMQVARIKLGKQAPVIKVGNLSAERDFLHVKDVASAYALAILHSDKIASGTILNIASGAGIPIHVLLKKLVAISTTEIRIFEDPTRLRRVDIPRFVGDSSLARELLGWTPCIGIDRLLEEVLAHCEVQARNELG